MDDTLTVAVGRTGETRFVLNLGVYRERAAAKGATTAEQARAIAGISRSTEYRWKRGVSQPNWPKARKAAQRLGTTEKELFAEVAS